METMPIKKAMPMPIHEPLPTPAPVMHAPIYTPVPAPYPVHHHHFKQLPTPVPYPVHHHHFKHLPAPVPLPAKVAAVPPPVHVTPFPAGMLLVLFILLVLISRCTFHAVR